MQSELTEQDDGGAVGVAVLVDRPMLVGRGTGTLPGAALLADVVNVVHSSSIFAEERGWDRRVGHASRLAGVSKGERSGGLGRFNSASTLMRESLPPG